MVLGLWWRRRMGRRSGTHGGSPDGPLGRRRRHRASTAGYAFRVRRARLDALAAASRDVGRAAASGDVGPAASGDVGRAGPASVAGPVLRPPRGGGRARMTWPPRTGIGGASFAGWGAPGLLARLCGGGGSRRRALIRGPCVLI